MSKKLSNECEYTADSITLQHVHYVCDFVKAQSFYYTVVQM